MLSQSLIKTVLATVGLGGSLLVGQSSEIQTDGRRSVHVAVRSLERQYGWRITYEDPPYSQGEVERVEPDIAFLAPRGSPMKFSVESTAGGQPVNGTARQVDLADLSLESPAGRQASDALARTVNKTRTLNDLLRQHVASRNPGAFAAISNGDFIHVVPTTRIDEAGRTVAYSSLLDTPVMFPSADRTVGEIVDMVLQQVSATRGVKIVQGLVLCTMYKNEHQVRAALGDSAEDTLVRTFEFASHQAMSNGAAARRVTWDLLYDCNGKQFYFSTHVLTDAATATTFTGTTLRGSSSLPVR
jgi:hypothetical protein